MKYNLKSNISLLMNLLHLILKTKNDHNHFYNNNLSQILNVITIHVIYTLNSIQAKTKINLLLLLLVSNLNNNNVIIKRPFKLNLLSINTPNVIITISATFKTTGFNDMN